MQSAPPDLEARAERAVRRGELRVALELFEALLVERPEDDRLRNRMDAVRALLQPSEMVGRRRAEAAEEDGPASPMELLSDAEQAELHASSGRFAEAVACYARALAKAPKNELLRERYEELKQYSLPPGNALADGLASAEKLEAPGKSAATIALLQALLQRVRGKRRRTSAGA